MRRLIALSLLLSFPALAEVSSETVFFVQPDGRHFLYVVTSESAAQGVYIGSLDGQAGKKVLSVPAKAVYASGHLLYIQEATLMAQPFDVDRRESIGEPFPVAEEVNYVRTSSGVYVGSFSASETTWRCMSLEQIRWFSPPTSREPNGSGRFFRSLPIVG